MRNNTFEKLQQIEYPEGEKSNNRLWLYWIFIPLSVFLFDFLFWEMKGAGINFPLFTTATLAFCMLIRQNQNQSALSIALIFSSFITGIALVVIHSPIAFSIHLFCWFLAIGKVLHPSLRSLPFLAVSQIWNIFSSGIQVFFSLAKFLPGFGQVLKFRKAMALGCIPILVSIIFYAIYLGANPRFEAIHSGIVTGLADWFSQFFTPDFFLRFFFWIFGFFLSSGAIAAFNESLLPNVEKSFDDRLLRIKKTRIPAIELWKLKNEFNAGIILLCLLNVFLFVVNLIDISWIWWNFRPTSP